MTTTTDGLHLGIADHYGWAVAVTATADHRVVDRRRLELLGPDLPAAPIHHEGGTHGFHGSDEPLDDDALAALVATVRASARAVTAASLDALAADVPGPITTVVLRAWPAQFPTDIAVVRRPPHESRADPVMYRQVLAEVATSRGWEVRTYDARDVEYVARQVLGDRSDDVLQGPRARLGPPWTKDHRVALAATIVAD